MTEEKNLAALAAMSQKYGADPDYVLAGGGNTSYKNDRRMWIKGSGTALATIKPEDFVVMDRSCLKHMWDTKYPEEEAAREAAVLRDTMAARVPGEERRPSVETMLHDLFPQRFILHAHPGLVNGITCAREGEAAMKRLFPHAVWVAASKPGYTLALACRTAMETYKAETGRDTQVVFLQNHGIFIAGDTVQEIDVLAQEIMGALAAQLKRLPDMEATGFDDSRVAAVTRRIRALLGGGTVTFDANREILAYDPTTGCLTPDHIVYTKARQLGLESEEELEAAFVAFQKENGYPPRIVFIRGLGMFACGTTEKEALTARVVMLDGIGITVYAESFGGVFPMTKELVDFITGWEVERYRSKVSLG